MEIHVKPLETTLLNYIELPVIPNIAYQNSSR